MNFGQLSRRQQNYARRLRDRAWKAGLTDVTVSQIAKDLDGWEQRISEAEAAGS